VVRFMVTTDRVEIVIDGLPEDDGRVRLNAFMSQLQRFSAALTRLDRDIGDAGPGTVFQIDELSYSSPARVVLVAKPMHGRPFTGDAVLARFEHVANTIASGGNLEGFDADLLEDIYLLARNVGRSVKNTAIFLNGTKLDLTPVIAARLDNALAVADECDGSVEGMLEQINIHLGANTFHVYPDIGPKKVTCRFPARLAEDAISAVGRRVEVYGTLRYRAGAPFAHQIAVTGLEAFPPEHELPDWEDIRGRAPDATGALSSEAFIRELRDGWE
jgi:hypothetical protein